MRRFLRAMAPAAALAALALAAPATSHAFVAGLGDQKPETFSDPLFRALKVKRTRYIVAWDAVNDPVQRARVDAWFAAARRAKLEILVAFNHSAGMQCPAQPCHAPRVSAYTRAVKKFHRRWGRYVKAYQPWNESNSATQPTSSMGKGRRQAKKGARLVARYYLALKKIAGRKRTVTGADIQDIGAFTQYAKDFLAAIPRKQRPKVMGLHNYNDTNYRRTRYTQQFIKALPRGTKIWLTETGGLYRFTPASGVGGLPPSESRQKRAMSHLFKLARKFRRQIDRVYIYQWKANATDRFDAGVVSPEGQKRPAYDVLVTYRKYFR